MLGEMPVSSYGDGIKMFLLSQGSWVKMVLALSNGIAMAAGGILLIDEIETAIHKKYYDDIFRFIVKACKAFNLQAFITTHSIEAIDAILRYGNYENNNAKVDPIKVITLKKIEENNGSNIVARNVTGKYVYENRKVFEYEVRL